MNRLYFHFKIATNMIFNIDKKTHFVPTVLLFVVFFFSFSQLMGQSFSIDWKINSPYSFKNDLNNVQTIENVSWKKGLPYISKELNNNCIVQNLKLISVASIPLNEIESNWVKSFNLNIPKDLTYSNVTGTEKGVVRNFFEISPYYMVGNHIERITSFELSVNYSNILTRKVFSNKSFVSNSQLKDGKIFALKIIDDGIYSIDRDFIKNLGIDLKGVNWKDIHIYSSNMGMLPQVNSGKFSDDLVQLAVNYTKNVNEQVNEGGKLLFFARGPIKLNYGQKTIEHEVHLYSKHSVYYLKIDPNTPAKVIQNLPKLTTFNNEQSTFNALVYHELEAINILKSGQRWYGESFDGLLNQQFTLNCPNRITDSSIQLKVAYAYLTKNSLNNFTLKANSINVAKIDLGSSGDDYARNEHQYELKSSTENITLDLTFNRGLPTSKLYLDYLAVNYHQKLIYTGSPFQFQSFASIGKENKTLFKLSNGNNNLNIWDITDIFHPKALEYDFPQQNNIQFIASTDSLRNFFVFDKNGVIKTPELISEIENQDIHGSMVKDLVIVTPKEFQDQAKRLAALHEQTGTSVHVFTTQEVYNEFSSGMVDPTAIRRMMIMFYEKAKSTNSKLPESLLLFGDATYDPLNRVPNNNYYVPTYETINSESYIASMVSDDYFGLLDENESFNGSDLMDISVGRLLISSQEHAVEQVNKIEHYIKNGSNFYTSSKNSCCIGDNSTTFGDWRTKYTMIADDEEDGYFLDVDTEPVYFDVKNRNPELNALKIYSDAYVQTSTPGGQRYPSVFDAITDRINRGTLVMNYVGHGGEVGAAQERIITIPQINSWTNIQNLPLFVTATCEFTRFDDPSRESAGELVSLNPKGGSIALMTTTRSVFFGVNSSTVRRFYQYVFSKDAEGKGLTFGEIMRLTKNNSGSSDNRRSFNLIGDPALHIALPQLKIEIDSINGTKVGQFNDTIKALDIVEVSGKILNINGTLASDFNGELNPTVYDKATLNTTLGNDKSSPKIPFEVRENALFKGTVSVKNGLFKFKYIVPKDISSVVGFSKLSLYGFSTTQKIDAIGFDTSVRIGGVSDKISTDNKGPEVQIYMNDLKFVDGSITGKTPLLYVQCFDSSGINTVGNGIGHDITAIIDGNTAKPIILNEYYKGKLDSYQSGEIKYVLPEMKPGSHSVEVKVWDVNNNSSISRINFVVVDDENMGIDKVYNYPNPFTTSTKFIFEHNQSCSFLDTRIQIFTVSGKLVKTINRQVETRGFQTEGIEWDGKDDFGNQLAKGVYIYKLSVEVPNVGKSEKTEKLVLLR